MSDTAFKSAPYASYTTIELARAADAPRLSTAERIRMLDEISRRERVEAGDMDSMTPGERLRFIKSGEAR
ncbi:hypothetical protein [Mesorhizobium argentiipisi]|uniref:Uncharacterized protein n=1 Tax=Mesorhizobium argentiipisi TaxID=3015175 RepID=A0ABU8KBW3_9HYPH